MMSKTASKAPAAYNRFVARFPDLGAAWDSIRRAEGEGPLDEQTQRIVKLAVAVGSRQIGAVHSAVRKARAAGVDEAAIEQVVALAAAVLGLPGTVAAHSWIREELD